MNRNSKKLNYSSSHCERSEAISSKYRGDCFVVSLLAMTQNNFFHISLVFCIFLLLGTAFAKKPDWIEGKSKKYPANRYLLGVGIGSSKEAAENEARAQIAKVFKSHVEAETKDYMESLKKISKKKTSVSGTEKIEQTTKITTDIILEGVVIEESYKDDDTYYALAVLDKIKHTNILSDRIASLDTEILSLQKEANASNNKITKIKNYNKALNKIPERNALNAELKIISPVGIGIDPTYSQAELAAKLDFSKQNLKVIVNISGDRIDDIQKTILSGLTKLGFKLQNDPDSECDVIVKGDIKISELDHPDKSWKWARYEANLELINGGDKSTIGTVVASGKAAQLTEDAAIQKAKDTLKKQLEEETVKKLSEYIFM